MARNRSKPISSEKLKLELSRRGVGIIEAALQMGYTQTAVRNAINASRISNQMLILLQSKFQISYEDIKPDCTAIPEKQQQISFVVLTEEIKNELYQIAYSACNAAFEAYLNS